MAHNLSQQPINTLPSTNCIVELFEIVLTKNFFMFENDMFIQQKGTAMASKMALNYANLYVLIFFKNTLEMVQGTVEEVNRFHSFINTSSEHLKLTLTFDDHEICFLDILIKRDGGGFSTDLYRKPTDRKSLLRGNSFHPTPLKKSLPISQYSRIRRICSTQSDYDKQADHLDECFRQRGYPEEWLHDARERFKNMTQDDSITPKPPRPPDQCFLQYSPLGKQFDHIIKNTEHRSNIRTLDQRNPVDAHFMEARHNISSL
ncbi:unnamed protein product, partial [Coregonus sp. 'balchen']